MLLHDNFVSWRVTSQLLPDWLGLAIINGMRSQVSRSQIIFCSGEGMLELSQPRIQLLLVCVGDSRTYAAYHFLTQPVIRN